MRVVITRAVMMIVMMDPGAGPVAGIFPGHQFSLQPRGHELIGRRRRHPGEHLHAMLGHVLPRAAPHAAGQHQIHAGCPQEARPLARSGCLWYDHQPAVHGPLGRIDLEDDEFGRRTVVGRKLFSGSEREGDFHWLGRGLT